MSYLAWQFVYGPLWLLQLAITLQRALFRLFSVPRMARTIFHHWRKDTADYHGSLSQHLQIFLGNQVSRAVGFLLRAGLLLAWAMCALALIPLALTAILSFIILPVLCLLMISVGLLFLLGPMP